MSAARSVSDVQSAVERIFPLVYEFRKLRTPADEELLRQRRARHAPPAPAHPAPPATDLRLVTLSDDEENAPHARGQADAWE